MTPRKHGLATLPLKCPHCARRLKHSVPPHGGVLRCDECNRLQFVLLIGMPAELAYVAEISRHELRDLYARGARAREVLETLGIEVRAA